MIPVMSTVLRRSLASSVRKFSAAADGAASHDGSARMWKIASFTVALPAIGLCMLNVYLSHKHEHQKPFIAYEHLRLRTKRFPWGDGNHSLFHDPKLTPLPTGYEEVEE